MPNGNPKLNKTVRRKKRILARIIAVPVSGALLVGIAFILALAVENTNGFGMAAPLPTYTPAFSNPATSAETPAPIPTPVVTPPPANGVIDNSAWNFLGAVERSINEVPPVNANARMLTLPENGRAPDEYFTSVAFLGDSITQGFRVYGKTRGGSVCAYKGISLKAIYDGSQVDRGDGVKEAPLEALAASAPQNVYVMMGPNSYIAYRQDESFVAYYDEMVKKIVERLGPDVNIYLQSITPVIEGTPRFDMDRIRHLNDEIATIAHNNGVYYLDLHEILANENGYLKSEYGAGDGYHLKSAAYDVWLDYILTHTVKTTGSPTI